MDRIEAIRAEGRPDYTPLARALLPKIREAAEDPDVMAEYEDWKKRREETCRN